MKKLITFIFSLFLCLYSFSQFSPFLHVDQFGYAPQAEKVAVLSNPLQGYNSNLSYSPGATIELRNSASNQVVFAGSPSSWKNGNTDPISGDQGWWFDFSSVTTPGRYHIFDPTNNERSPDFEIAVDPYRKVLKAAGRMFFYNRCNMPKALPFADSNWVDADNFNRPLQDANCRYIYAPGDSSLERDLSGGWFDAGDYNKYVTFTHSTLHNMLSAYEEHPRAFGDNWNIPESGNGLPDLLDEVKWELDWLLKMTNADGTVQIKMGSRNYQENTSTPPSANVDQRYYGPTCTSASATVAGVFAHAALVFEQFPAWQNYAASLSQKAVSAYNYVVPHFLNNTLETNCDDGSIVSGDADVTADDQRDILLTAAAYLHAHTGQASYAQLIENHAQSTEGLTSGYWGAEDLIVNEALIRYAIAQNGTTLTANAILMSVTAAANNNVHGFWGFGDKDLYRAHVPDWSYYWGSNQIKANFGSLNRLAARWGIASDSANQARKAAEQVHYFHGVNPLGLVYLSNMYALGGDRCVNEIYHGWFADGSVWDHALSSPKGPAPGYLTGGPNEYFSVTSLSPPAGQPAAKSFLDFNDGFPLNSWEITEPAIYYQAAYLRLLAGVVAPQALAAVPSAPANQALRAYPNPGRGSFCLQGLTAPATLRVFDVQGRQVMYLFRVENAQVITLPARAKGLLFLEVQSLENNDRYTLRLLSQ